MERDICISVIVPVYNAERYLRRCVDSVLAQTYENWELLLVDDGSRDGSAAICQEYARKDSRIQVLRKENGGASSARNLGIGAASGEYLTFLDCDDWIAPEAYETMLALALEHGSRLVSCGRWDVESTGEKTLGLCPERQETVDAEEAIRRILRWEGIDSAVWDKLFHRDLFRDIRFPEGITCEDIAIVYRLVMEAGNVTLCSQPLYHYFHHPGSITTSALSETSFHFTYVAEEMCPRITQAYPKLAREARYFYVRSLVYAMQCVALAGEEDRRKFEKQHREAASALRAQLPFLLSCPFFGKKERLTDLLIALGLYRPLRQLLRREK